MKLFIVIFAITLSACSPESLPPGPEESKGVEFDAQPKTIEDLASLLEGKESGTDVSLLFVVSVKSGKFSKIDDSRHEFKFKTADIDTAIAFTDRPQRQAFDLTIPMLAALWDSKGKNNFAVNPPNAAIKDSKSRIAITELTGFQVDGEVATFQLDRMRYREVDSASEPLEGRYADSSVDDLTLFIDSGAGLITTAGVAGLLRTAAGACAEVACYLWPIGG